MDDAHEPSPSLLYRLVGLFWFERLQWSVMHMFLPWAWGWLSCEKTLRLGMNEAACSQNATEPVTQRTHSCLWCSWCRFHLKPHAGLSAIFSPCSRLHLGVCSGYLCSLLCLPKISPLPLSSQHLLMSGDLILFTFPIFPLLPFLSSPLYLVLCPSPPLLPFSQVFNPSIQSRVLWCN